MTCYEGEYRSYLFVYVEMDYYWYFCDAILGPILIRITLFLPLCFLYAIEKYFRVLSHDSTTSEIPYGYFVGIIEFPDALWGNELLNFQGKLIFFNSS